MTHPDLPTGVSPGGRFAAWDPDPPRYLVLDVDGTLVRPDGETATGVASRVAALQDAGVTCGLATGRMRPSVAGLWHDIGAAGPHVLHNGAEVYGDDRVLHAWPLARGEVGALIEVATAHDAYLEVYVEDGFYVTVERAPESDHWPMLGHAPLGLIGDLPDDAVYPKATFALTSPATDQLLRAIRHLGLLAGPAHSPLTPHLHYVNATNPQAEKGAAVRVAATQLGVGLDEVVAIGDGENDLSMFAVVGTAIAMGQSSQDVRAAAHLVVPDADVDGVLVALDAALAWA